MGMLHSCCNAEETVKDRLDINIIRTKDEKEKLLANDGMKSSDHDRTGSGTKSISGSTPHITIKAEPLIAEYIFNYPSYLKKRQNLEHHCENIIGVTQITYDQNKWTIFSENIMKFEQCRQLFDIIIWRLPVIQAFGNNIINVKEYLKNKLNINEINHPTIVMNTTINETEDVSINTILNTKTITTTNDGEKSNPFDFEELNLGLWDILSKQEFINRFNNILLNKLDYINDKNYSYLIIDDIINGDGGTQTMNLAPTLSHRRSISRSATSRTQSSRLKKQRSSFGIGSMSLTKDYTYDIIKDSNNNNNNDKEFIEFKQKLSKIKSAQKSDIIIIGQKNVVRYIIRQIRELEVKHPAMIYLIRQNMSTDLAGLSPNMFNDSNNLTNMGTAGRARAGSTLVFHTIKAENIPPDSTEEEIMEFFKEYGKVLDVVIADDNLHHKHKHKIKPSELELDKQLSEHHIKPIDINNINSDGTPKSSRIANIAFETKTSQQRVLNAADSETGLEMKGYVLVIKEESAKTIEKRRKKRRVTSERKMF